MATTSALVLLSSASISVAHASVIHASFSSAGNDVTYLQLISATGNQQAGYFKLWAWDGAATTTISSAYGSAYDYLGGSWSASPTNLWTSQGCSTPLDDTSAVCNFDSSNFFNVTANALPAGTYMAELSDTGYTGGDIYLYGPFVWDGATLPSTGTSTRIIAPIPANNAITATTSFELGADVYINQDDFLSDTNAWSVRVKYGLQAYSVSTAGASPSLFFHVVDFPLGHSGESIKSTTTPALAVGKYSYIVEIRKESFLNSALHLLSFGLYDASLVRTQTFSFTVVATNAYDKLIASTTEALENPQGAASTTATLNDCAAFHMSECVYALFLPPVSDSVEFQQLSDGLQRKPPFGYFSATASLWGALTTTTPAFVIPVFVFAPLSFITSAITIVLYCLFAYWLWRRITMWDWHL